MNSTAVSHAGITGVEDSQETRLPEFYNRDPAATQRVQIAIASGCTSSTFDEDDDIGPSQRLTMLVLVNYHQWLVLLGKQSSSVAGTPREYYHAFNWETSHENSDSAPQLLLVAGTPCFFSPATKAIQGTSGLKCH
jgi:hypothetical protein